MTCALDWTDTRHDPEVQLRIRPLREQWEARGPGMLAFLSRKLPWLQHPDRLSVELSKPGAAGHEQVVSADTIHFQAFLFNPLPQLPEVVRLVWMCTRAAISESYQDTRVAAGLIPAAIEAAEFVELASLDSVTVSLALQNWFPESPQLAADRLLEWWREMPVSTLRSKEAWLHAVRKLDPLTP